MRGTSFDMHFHRRPTEAGGEEAWAVFPIDDGAWTGAYRIASQDGQPVLAEIRIYPTDLRRPWTDRQSDDGRTGVPPRGGLTARLLRSVKLGHHAAVIRRRIAESAAGGTLKEQRAAESPVQDFNRDIVRSLGFEPPAAGQGKKPGRPRRPDLFYARIAARYVEELEAGNRRPTAAVAESSHFSAPHIRDAVHEARVRGLLTRPPSQGRPGGQLTDRARSLLRDAE